METQIAIGPEAQLKFEMKDGKIKIASSYAGVDLSAGAFVATTPEQFCHALGQIIPGESALEHGFLSMLKYALTEAAGKKPSAPTQVEAP